MPKRRLLNISRPNADNSSPHSQSNESITQLQSQHDIDLDSQTASRSLSNLEEQDGPQLCSGQRKRTRGPTRMADVWELNKGEQVIIQINERGQLVGDGSSVLSQFTGTIARMSHLAPINCLSWYKMPKANKDEIWNIIESKFKFEPIFTEQIKKIVMEDVGKKWRNWKNDLKSKAYNPNKSEQELVANIPDPRVDKDQWQHIVRYWCSEKGKKVSDKNRDNRSKQKEPHCTGTKSFARFIQEKTKDGVMPTRAEVYIYSHTRKDGNIVNEEAAKVVELMKKGMNDPGTSQGLKDYHSWKTDVYSQIKGPDKRCRVRCVGKLPTSKKSCSLSSTDVHYQRQKLLKEEISNLKETVTSLLTILQKRFPEDVANVLREASHPREVPDANSAPDPSSRGDISSSSSNHQS